MSEPHHYGTFQPVKNYPSAPPEPPPPPPTTFPQPVPPPGAADPPPPPPPGAPYYVQSYQAVPGYPVAEGRPVRQRRLRCCGLGCGWFLFIIGFLLVAIPWYVGVIILICSRVDYREKPGFIACSIAAAVATAAIILGATKGAHLW